MTGPIVDPGTVAYLEHSLTALDVHLGEPELARLDEIFPGPGPAPEAYACLGKSATPAAKWRGFHRETGW